MGVVTKRNSQPSPEVERVLNETQARLDVITAHQAEENPERSLAEKMAELEQHLAAEHDKRVRNMLEGRAISITGDPIS